MNNPLHSKTTQLSEADRSVRDRRSQDEMLADLRDFAQRKSELVFKQDPLSNLTLFPPEDWQFLDEAFRSLRDPGRVLEELRPAFQDWGDKYARVLDLFEAHGFEIRSFAQWQNEDAGKPVGVIYHDVHAWDVFPALALADENRRRGVSTTFYLMWRFDGEHLAHEDAYKAFRHLVGPGVDPGLHAGPVSTWIFHDLFKQDGDAFAKWATSSQSADDLSALAAGEGTGPLAGFDVSTVFDRVQDTFNRTVGSFKEYFPDATTVNHHGDFVARTLQRLSSASHVRTTLGQLVPKQYLTANRAESAGLEKSLCETLIRFDTTSLFSYTEDANREYYLEMLDKTLARAKREGRSVFLINHPASFSNETVVINKRYKPSVRKPAPAQDTAAKPAQASAPARVQLPDVDLSKGIYLVGFARGGTTWARTALGLHPDVYEVPNQVELTGMKLPLSRQVIAQRIGLRAKNTKQNIADFDHFITKAPINALVLPEMIQAMPEARFVFIVRDPRDVLISYQRTGSNWTDAQASFEEAMGRTQQYCRRLSEAMAAGRVTIFRYEDLHQDFDRTYRRLCRDLGLRDDPELAADVRRRTSFSSMTGRKHQEKAAAQRKGVVGDWANHLTYTDATRYQADPFWVQFFQQYGYHWTVPTWRYVLSNMSAQGVQGRSSCFARETGARMFILLDGLQWQYPELARMRLDTMTELLEQAGIPYVFSISEPIQPDGIKFLSKHYPDRELAIEIPDRWAHALEGFRLKAETVKTLGSELDAAGLNCSAVVARLGSEGKRKVFHRSLNGYTLIEPDAEQDSVIKETENALSISGLPADFQVLDPDSYQHLAHARLTMFCRPAAASVDAPVTLAFRAEFEAAS